MTKSIFSTITLLSLITVFISCNSSINNKNYENQPLNDTKTINESTKESSTQANSIASDFVKHLETGKQLSSFFTDSWSLIYHEDNRCDGSTDGQLENLKKSVIDSTITLQVKNDGDGWACDKKDPETFNLEFDLKEKIAKWDRFEIPDYGNEAGNTIYVLGWGESDYLILHFEDKNLITKFEYRSEDPG